MSGTFAGLPVKPCALCGNSTIGWTDEPEPFVCRTCDKALEDAERASR